MREKERKMVLDFHSLDPAFHLFSRMSPYPSAPDVARCYVPDHLVEWDTPFPEYHPPVFTAASVTVKPTPTWADSVDLLKHPPLKRPQLAFNDYDKIFEVDRRSHEGSYLVEEGVPINPQGRTGLRGRGCLGRWGPNAAGEAIVTRWKRDPVMHRFAYKDGKKVLQFVATRSKGNEKWGLPGGLRKPGQGIHELIQSEFTEEALGNLEGMENQKEQLEDDLDLLFAHGQVVYKGYVDDARNTDNAWVETMAMNFHDEDGTLLTHFQFRAGEAEGAVAWLDLEFGTDFEPSTSLMLRITAQKLGAAF